MMEIKQTTDYGLFKLMSKNRPVGNSSIKKLARSISCNDLTPYKPIIVDKDFRIVDGQHRFLACKYLNKPIYFLQMADDIDGDSAMITLNTYQKSWRQEEFLNFHAETKGGQWKELQDFEKEHKLGISNSIVVFPNIQINSTDIREGVKMFHKSDKADAIADFLQSEPICSLKFSKTRAFVLAVRKAFDKYSDRKLAKLRKKIIYLEMSANYEQYLTAFENLLK